MKFVCSETCNAKEELISKVRGDLKNSINLLQGGAKDADYLSPYSFLAIPGNERGAEEIISLANKKRGEGLKTLFLVGIGGANLATRAVHRSLGEKNGTRVIFLDTVSSMTPDTVEKEISLLQNKEEFLLAVISKSGATIETITNAQFASSYLEKKFGNISSRTVFVTKKDSPLWKEGEVSGVSLLSVPESVSDRFSAFLPTALFPLTILGFNINDFLEGARDTMQKCLEDSNSNPAIISASVLNSQYESGVKILDSFLFHPNLEDLGKWSRQLVAESLGKENRISGEKANTGFTPTVSVGTTDLHSMLQLYLAGPKDRFTQFIFVSENNPTPLLDSMVLGTLDDGFVSKTPDEISKAIFESVKKSYADSPLPFAEIVFDKISEKEIGAYMAFKMIETVMVGALWNIDVFNQPNVEEYKKRALDALG